ncbi:hypothetical protein Patl1_24827 [Pistacia atlantica]|uniref:Uncharacterized protein n=1 Tax=Pistacia atlantica TaxID=434234 RepID=A0ACC1B3R3_9ROSI|nr:hypothetical protein Patl1_24827 [Pistacia atlantica]
MAWIVKHQATEKKGSNSGSPVPDMTGQGRDSKVKVFPGEDLPDGCHQGIPFVDSASKAHHAGDENKRKQNCGASPRKEKQGTDLQDIDQSVSSKGNSGDDPENISSMQTPNIREAIARRGRKHGKSGLGCLLNGLHVKNAMENVKFPDNVLVRSLRAQISSKLEAAFELLERQMPLFVSLTTKFYNACDYVKMKFQQVYPWALTLFCGWGPTSFFSVIWCSILSVIAMVGMAKFLMVLVIPALVAFFIGFTLAIIVVVPFGNCFSMVLWKFLDNSACYLPWRIGIQVEP